MIRVCYMTRTAAINGVGMMPDMMFACHTAVACPLPEYHAFIPTDHTVTMTPQSLAHDLTNADA